MRALQNRENYAALGGFACPLACESIFSHLLTDAALGLLTRPGS